LSAPPQGAVKTPLSFEQAWAVFLSKRTEADFQKWRDQQAWTAEKYRRFDRGERMPSVESPPIKL